MEELYEIIINFVVGIISYFFGRYKRKSKK